MNQTGADTQSSTATLWSTVPWTTVIVALALVLIVVLVVLLVLWWRRRAERTPRAAPDRGPSLRRRIHTIWREFARSLPLQARHYPTVIVMGEAGVGKSHLIDVHVDWRGQTHQYRPSLTGYTELQLYMGPDVLVHEISAPLLRDDSHEAERALAGLWRRSRRHPATVVVVLNAHALATASPHGLPGTLPSTEPDAGKELAQLVRGKLHILSARGRRPVHLRLCLTHLDEIEGFSRFASLLRERGHELRIGTAGQSIGEGELTGALDPFEGHLSLALTTCAPEEFREVVAFYQETPALFTALGPFLRSLCGDEPFAPTYRVEGVYLGALSRSDHVGNPFAVDSSAVVTGVRRARRRVYATCGAILGTAAVGLALLFGWYENRVTDTEKAVAAFDAAARTPQPVAWRKTSRAAGRDEVVAERTAETAMRDLAADSVLWLSQSFLPRKRALHEEFLSAIRNTYLLPRFSDDADRKQLLYAASLLYAARDTALGDLVRASAAHWARELGLSERMVLDYVHHSATPWSGLVDLPEDLTRTPSREVPRAWVQFLAALERALAQRKLTPEQLASLQAMRPSLSASEDYDMLARIAEVLSRDSRLRVELAPLLDIQPASEWVREHYDSLTALVAAVDPASLAVPDVEGWTMAKLLGGLRDVAGAPRPARAQPQATQDNTPAATDTATGSSADAAAGATAGTAAGATAGTAAGSPTSAQSASAQGQGTASQTSAPQSASAQPPDETYTFALTGRTFVFDPDAWTSLLARSRAGILVADFMSDVRASDRSPFFGERTIWPAAGGGLGSRQGPTGVIPGQYTRPAFTEDVAPVLAAMDAGLPDIAIDQEDADLLDSLLLASITDYAADYRQALEDYYDSFQFDAPIEEELVFELQSIARPSSWFVSFLRTVATHASLPLGESRFYQPLAENLAPFASLVALMTESEGKYPQLLPYQAIIADLHQALDADSGAGAGDAQAEPTLALSAAGALAYDVVTGKAKSRARDVRAWLTTADIDSQFRDPFLRPVEQVYEIGYANIEEALAQAWQTSFRDPMAALLGKFPFDPRAAQEAAIADVEAWFQPPTGRFWQAFVPLIQPLAVESNGKWRLRSPLRGPAGMMRTINRIARLSSALWNQEGKRTALALGVTPLTLPTEQVRGRAATLAFLKAGSSSVYGFNQKPEQQTLALEWWAQDQASVGVQLRAVEGRRERIYTLDAGPSVWSFLRLLAKADGTLPGELTWKVTVPLGAPLGTRSVSIRFELATDPRDLFRIGGAS